MTGMSNHDADAEYACEAREDAAFRRWSKAHSVEVVVLCTTVSSPEDEAMEDDWLMAFHD